MQKLQRLMKVGILRLHPFLPESMQIACEGDKKEEEECPLLLFG